MPQKGVDQAPLLERLVYFYDGSDYRVGLCDSNGNIVVALKANQVIEVTQDTAADLQATVTPKSGEDFPTIPQGKYEASWEDSPWLWGISEGWQENVVNSNASAGSNELRTTAVPAGEVWVTNHICARNTTSSYTSLNMYLEDPNNDWWHFYAKGSPSSGTQYYVDRQFVLTEDCHVLARFVGCTSGDNIFLRVWGYKMRQ